MSHFTPLNDLSADFESPYPPDDQEDDAQDPEEAGGGEEGEEEEEEVEEEEVEEEEEDAEPDDSGFPESVRFVRMSAIFCQRESIDSIYISAAVAKSAAAVPSLCSYSIRNNGCKVCRERGCNLPFDAWTPCLRHCRETGHLATVLQRGMPACMQLCIRRS